MDDRHSRTEDLKPLGKSVEEVEGDSQNRVNPPAPDGEGAPGAAVVPAALLVNTTGSWVGTSGIGAGTPEVPTGPVLLPDEERER